MRTISMDNGKAFTSASGTVHSLKTLAKMHQSLLRSEISMIESYVGAMINHKFYKLQSDGDSGNVYNVYSVRKNFILVAIFIVI
jgi:hypothetical protein